MQTKISGTGFTKITDHWSKSIVDLAIDSAKQANIAGLLDISILYYMPVITLP